MTHSTLRATLRVFAAGGILMLAACGQKGPLYLPSSPPPPAPDATLSTPPNVSPAPKTP